ncbi:PfkB family carbohydrate kinase [Vulcanisaeta sp. JCM 14467]|uniref:PfkB family carbohydrate kinase n=1 Tax=Vulcanisaeta sp. JCM 14467 TaxID=1295370 RepID=UPI0006D240F1|nr:PfkB family carbohydrate kinase [Vulcanisaeta sp. JCM 14467]
MLGIIGHTAIDIIRRGSTVRRSPGGAPTYCSFYLKQLGIEPLPITLVGSDFNNYLNDYRVRGIVTDRIKVLNDCDSTSYEITYYDTTRRLRLLARCRNFAIHDLYDLPDTVAVNPIAREVSLDVMRHIRGVTRFVGVDLQGFTRVFDENNYVDVRININDVVELMRYADVIKASVDDVSMDEFNAIISKYPDKIVVLTMGANGSILMHNGRKFHVSTDGIVNAKDPTGAGDVLTCALTYMLGRGEDLEWSFIFSNAVAVAKTMGEGPYGVINNGVVDEIANKLFSRLTRA